jgi:hypothetical protein
MKVKMLCTKVISNDGISCHLLEKDKIYEVTSWVAGDLIRNEQAEFYDGD